MTARPTFRHPAVEAAELIADQLTSTGKQIKIVAYGSLMNANDAKRSLGRDVDITLGFVAGWQRAWNVVVSAAQQPPPPAKPRLYVERNGASSSGRVYEGPLAMLGMSPNRQERELIGVFSISANELPLLAAREKNYALVDVSNNVTAKGFDTERDITLMFVPLSLWRGNEHQPAAQLCKPRAGYVDNIRTALEAIEPDPRPLRSGRLWNVFGLNPRGDVTKVDMVTLTPDVAAELADGDPAILKNYERLLTIDGQTEASASPYDRAPRTVNDYLQGEFSTLRTPTIDTPALTL